MVSGVQKFSNTRDFKLSSRQLKKALYAEAESDKKNINTIK